MATKIFEAFLEKVLEFPFWVKETLYVKLREEFEQAHISEIDLKTPIEESYQLHIPLITFIGKKELEERINNEDERIYRFLQVAKEGCSIAEITMRNFWTLEDTAKINVLCIQKEYLAKPTSQRVLATALYMSGRIKLGDYFKRIGKITVEQIDTAIRRQKEMEAQGNQTQFAQILVSLGFISEDETKAVIYMKDECKKRFIFNANLLGKSAITESAEKIALHSEFENSSKNSSAQLVLLRQEVYDLQKKLKEIASIIKR